MKFQAYTKTIIYAAVIVWTIVLVVNRENVSPSFFKPLSTVTTVVVWLAILLDGWLWKSPFLHGWLVKRPVIDGTWKAEIQSNWIDPLTGEKREKVEAFMVVRQTLSTLSMRLLTAESSSVLVGTEIVCSPDGTFCVSGVYRNEPWFKYREGSQIHYGGLWLQIADQRPGERLIGHYWTDRNTAGTLQMSDRIPQKLQTYEAARKATSHDAS
jgi:SMODS-associating 2TM, beta-strand rich effector domain